MSMNGNGLNNAALSCFSGCCKTLHSLRKVRRIIKNNAIVAVNGHNHTTASDGVLGSSRLLFLNWLAGFNSMIVTDHNALRWNAKEKLYARYSKRILNIEFCPGIEFSCFFDLSEFGGDERKEFHIVGIGIDPDDERLRVSIENIQRSREKMTEEMIQKVIGSGYSIIPFEELKKKAGGNVTLPDIANNVRARNGEKVDPEKFIQDHLAAGKDCHVINGTLISVEEAVNTIRLAGGRAVWAHPKYTMENLFKEHFENLALKLKDLGIEGIEAFREIHDAEDTRMIKSFCADNGLEIRAGSDMHRAKDLIIYIRNMVEVFEQDKDI